MAKRTTRTTTPKTVKPIESSETFPAASEPLSDRATDTGAPTFQALSAGSDPTEQDIRARAYRRYLDRGGQHGRDFDDWIEAERELKMSR